ncbi:MAG: PHP domain-containing protein [Kiritimatiellia bacterium]|nr:PHP domain-containing protein [Kiritimatiellia bacterium]
MNLRADLHLHSCLSPCGSLRLSPSRIVRRARETGLEAIALTDHNTARHVPLTARLCREAGLVFVRGLEAHSSEEIHVLCLFEQEDAALEFGQFLYAHLPPVRCIPEKMGDQVIVNEAEEILETLDRYLVNATDLTLTEIVERAHQMGGLAIPAHVDRPSSGLLGRLGFLPPLPCPTLEVSARYDRKRDPSGLAAHHRLITGSDAHEWEDIGNVFTNIEVRTRTTGALIEALRCEGRTSVG